MGAVLTAGSLLLVIVLYAITAFSKQAFVSQPAIPAQENVAEDPSLANAAMPADLEEQTAAIRASADTLTGAVRAARLAELVNVYLGRGYFGRAARVQAEVAATLETAEAWADAGNIAYRAMQEAEGAAKMDFANDAIDAYRRSLEIDPEDHDVRTDMATAYLATNNPMEGVRQIRRVLERDPEHLQANFNYGVMLNMIGRADQSIVQFEKVRSLAPPGSDSYQQAELALRELRGN